MNVYVLHFTSHLFKTVCIFRKVTEKVHVEETKTTLIALQRGTEIQIPQCSVMILGHSHTFGTQSTSQGSCRETFKICHNVSSLGFLEEKKDKSQQAKKQNMIKTVKIIKMKLITGGICGEHFRWMKRALQHCDAISIFLQVVQCHMHTPKEQSLQHNAVFSILTAKMQ